MDTSCPAGHIILLPHFSLGPAGTRQFLFFFQKTYLDQFGRLLWLEGGDRLKIPELEKYPEQKNTIHSIRRHMWTSFVENPEMIESLYGRMIPELSNVWMRELKILFGSNVQCFLRFDLRKLPDRMPTKWDQKNVNAVQFNIALIDSDIRFLQTLNGDLIGDLKLVGINGNKHVSFVAKDTIVFEISTMWIHLQSINGYCSEY